MIHARMFIAVFVAIILQAGVSSAASWGTCDWAAAKRLADDVSVVGQNMQAGFKAKTDCKTGSCLSRLEVVMKSVKPGSKEEATLRGCDMMLRKYLDRL